MNCYVGGPLQEILSQDGFLPENTICRFGKDILLGIKHLHDRGIVFADLCPKKVSHTPRLLPIESKVYSAYF